MPKGQHSTTYGLIIPKEKRNVNCFFKSYEIFYVYIFKHHIDYINTVHPKRDIPYGQEDPHTIVIDYIASMTDNYFIDLHRFLFPESELSVKYMGYFEDLK